MPFPLHKAPVGLLELFRLRTLGSNPPEFAGVVQPTVDVAEFYSADLKLFSGVTATTGALAGLSSVLTLTGPIRMHAIGARLVIGAAAATNVVIMVGMRDTQTGLRAPLASQVYGAVAATQEVHIGALVRGLVFPPTRWSVYAQATGTAAGADHILDVRLLIDNITGQS